jgi:hypothetical protein
VRGNLQVKDAHVFIFEHEMMMRLGGDFDFDRCCGLGRKDRYEKNDSAQEHAAVHGRNSSIHARASSACELRRLQGKPGLPMHGTFFVADEQVLGPAPGGEEQAQSLRLRGNSELELGEIRVARLERGR